jgi:hypothetical protein
MQGEGFFYLSPFIALTMQWREESGGKVSTDAVFLIPLQKETGCV